MKDTASPPILECPRCGFSFAVLWSDATSCPVCGAPPGTTIPKTIVPLKGPGRMPALIGILALIVVVFLSVVGSMMFPVSKANNLVATTSTPSRLAAVNNSTEAPIVTSTKTEPPTVAPTIIPSATPIPTPTETPQPTPTQTQTPTPTPTDTPVPPATQTAVALEATKQAEIAAIAATATTRAFNIEATRSAIAQQATSTAEANAALISMLAEYLPANLRELKDYADNHIGEKVFIAGRVFNIVPGDDSSFQIFGAGTSDALMITTLDPFSDLFKDEYITVYGTVVGRYCFNNAFGNETCQPRLAKAFYFKKQTAQMYAAQATAQAGMVKATQEARSGQATAQAEQRATAQARIADYKAIAVRELLTYPDNHMGEKVRVAGRVFNVLGDSGVLQMYAAGTYDAIFVRMEDIFTNVYENDNIVVYGTVGGQECFTNTAGGEVCQPLLEDAFFTK